MDSEKIGTTAVKQWNDSTAIRKWILDTTMHIIRLLTSRELTANSSAAFVSEGPLCIQTDIELKYLGSLYNGSILISLFWDTSNNNNIRKYLVRGYQICYIPDYKGFPRFKTKDFWGTNSWICTSYHHKLQKKVSVQRKLFNYPVDIEL